MPALKRQFFLSYAVIGSVMPLITVFLKEQGGFSFLQIGLAMSLMNLPMLCSPALITLLADRNVDARRILAIAFACSAVVLSLMFFSHSIALTLTLFVFHGLSFVAMLPLQDGYYFSLAEEARQAGDESVSSYPMVRVWGTIGFIIPSVLLFYPLSQGASARSILPCAIFFCVASLVNSFSLRPVRKVRTRIDKLPTRIALKKIFSSNAKWLSIGLFFGYMSASTYYTYVGNLYSEVVKIPHQYIGLILNLGVLLEVGYTLAMPWLQRKIQLKGILVAGLFAMTLRMVLLWCYPTPAVVVITQLVHGLEVLALFVGPVMFLDRLAGSEYRNSIQGVFTMAVGGISRVMAGVVGGFCVTHVGLRGGFLYAALLGLISFCIITFLFARIPEPDAESEKK